MSKKIVIVESDTSFSKKLKDELAKNGFSVLETGDGKGAFDLCRREKPDLVVLAVELSAGQSGYLVCGKLKKDDELKKTPVVIIGKDPEGFEGHKKLKTRAEEYLKKPFAPEALTAKVGALIGLPNDSRSGGEELIVDDESLGLSSIDTLPPVVPTTGKHDGSNLDDMFDQAFDNSLGTDSDEATVVHQAIPNLSDVVSATGDVESALSGFEVGDSTPADILPGEPSHENGIKATADDADSALSVLGGEEIHSDLDVIEIEETGPKVEAAPPALKMAARPRTLQPAAVFNDAELQSLRAKVSELEDKISGLENQVAERDSELAAAKATSGGAKDAAGLKEQLLKKDKEILKLKQELNEKNKEVNEKDAELVEVKEKEAAFEGQLTEKDADIAKRDAQLKSLQQKVDGLSAEKKKSDAALTSAKDEARAAASNLATVQGELDQHQDHIAELGQQLEVHKTKAAEHAEAAESARNEVEQLRGTLQVDLDQAQAELSAVRAELESHQNESKAQIEQLQARLAEVELNNTKNEDRVVKAYQKIKGDEKLREKTRKAISVALQLLEENTGANVVDETDLRT